MEEEINKEESKTTTKKATTKKTSAKKKTTAKKKPAIKKPKAKKPAVKKPKKVVKKAVKKVAKKPTAKKATAKKVSAATKKISTKRATNVEKSESLAERMNREFFERNIIDQDNNQEIKKPQGETKVPTPKPQAQNKATAENKPKLERPTEKVLNNDATKNNDTQLKKAQIISQASTTPVADAQQPQSNGKTKVLYVVSECHPFCATGGLADVAEGLPKYINKTYKNIDMRVVLPMYSDIPDEYRKNFKYMGHKYVPVAWRSVYCGLFTYELNGVKYYFLDNEYYFKRGGGIYSYFDDGERFAFTSRAVLELLSLMDFEPDIINCNDWQSALIPIYLKTIYKDNPNFNRIKTVFTLHNTEYQGKFSMKILGDLFGIDNRYASIVDYNGDLNLVKGAIVCCDKFSTVSPSYSQEILSPEHSNGLDSILRSNAYKICGILNAIDCDFYNPKTDPVLYKHFDVNSIEDKVQNKLAFQKECELEVNADIPMMCIVMRMAKHKGLDLIRSCMESVVQNNKVQFVAVGGGAPEYEDYLRYLESQYRGKVRALMGYSNILGRKAYGASDIFLMPSKSEPCGLSQMIASRYGAIPIVRETGGLKDSMWDFGCQDGGNAYTFSNYSTHDLVYSINRALNDYKDKTSWQAKMKICMSRDFSWKHSADGYINMYNNLMK